MIDFYIIIIAILTAVSCAILGVFLVQRKMALMSDAISHSVLPGIVVGVIITADVQSPFLILGAAATGLLMVFLVETLSRTRLLKEDASVGLIFPALFSIGVILISRDLANVHFHESTVLVGDIALSSLNHLYINNIDFGPKTIYVMGGLLLINIFFITLLFKELKLSTFDAALAAALGFSPLLIHYFFMGLVALTSVASFDAVGSILVIALMIAPASAAYLLTDNLKRMVLYSSLIGILSAVCGFFVATIFNASPSGSMAMTTGFFFLLTYLFAPTRGLLALKRKRKILHKEFSLQVLLLHLANHADSAEEQEECKKDNLHLHIDWAENYVNQIINKAVAGKFVYIEKDILKLTEQGKIKANNSFY